MAPREDFADYVFNMSLWNCPRQAVWWIVQRQLRRSVGEGAAAGRWRLTIWASPAATCDTWPHW